MIDPSLITNQEIDTISNPEDFTLDEIFEQVLGTLEDKKQPIGEREKEDFFVMYVLGFVGGLLFVDDQLKVPGGDVLNEIGKKFDYCMDRFTSIVYDRKSEKRKKTQ